MKFVLFTLQSCVVNAHKSNGLARLEVRLAQWRLFCVLDKIVKALCGLLRDSHSFRSEKWLCPAMIHSCLAIEPL